MATSVQIELMVDEKGAVSGVRAFDTAVKGTTGSVRQLGTELGAVGTRAAAAGRQGKAGLDQLGAAALGSKEKVRLLSEEIGVHIPRAMQSVIAKSPQVMSAINAIGGAMIGLGAIQIGAMVFTQLISGAHKLWEEHLSLTKAAEDYNAEVAKAKMEDFGNTRSIETTMLRINDATEAVKRYNTEAEKAAHTSPSTTWRSAANLIAPGAGGLWEAYHQRDMAHGLAGQATDAQRQLDKLNRDQKAEQTHADKKDAIELQHAYDWKLPKEQQITAEQQKQHQLNAEDRAFDANREGKYGNPVAAAAGAATYGVKDRLADARAAQELAELNKKGGGDEKSQAEELRRLHEEALESGLRGVALYQAREAAAIEDLKQKGIASAAAVNDVKAKFANEEMNRLHNEQRETEKIGRQAAMAGMTGIDKTRAEGAKRIADLDPDLDPAERAKRVAYINQETDQQIAAEKRTLAQEVDAIADQSATHQISGFARINAEATKNLDDLKKKIDYGSDKQGGASLLQRGKDAIEKGAADQRAELTHRNAQETAQIEDQARVKSLSAEKQKTAAIQAEYNERLQKYQDELREQEISQEDFNRRVAAAAQERDAEMVEATKEAHEKMAGEFNSLFKSLDHPLKALESMGDKVAGEAAASLVQHFQQRGGGGASSSPEGGLLGMFGGFNFGGGHRGTSGADAAAETRSHPLSAAEKTLSIAQARISIGSASFGGGGSTSLFASGSGGFSGATSTGSPSFGGGTYGSGDFAGGYSGGAGAGVGAAATPNFAQGGSGPVPAPRNLLGGMLSDVSQGTALFKQGASIFGGGTRQTTPAAAGGDGTAETQGDPLAGKLNADGSFTSAGSTNGGMLGGGGFGANAGGAIGGALGMYSAVKGNGGFGGAAQGAMAGMQLGMALGGPMGAAIGAGAGAIVGAIGFGGREQARVYDLKTIRPHITADQDAYNQGSMSYSDAYQDVTGLEGQSWAVTKKMGPAAHSYWTDTIEPEIKQALGKFTAEQRAGRSQYAAQGASYATGTDYVPATGWNLNHEGERIIPSDQNREITRALNTHAAYQRTMQSGNAGGSGGGDRTMNLNVHAIDAKGVAQFLDKYKHQIRGAMNDSYAENSGGGL